MSRNQRMYLVAALGVALALPASWMAAPPCAGQVRIDDPDDPFANGRRNRRATRRPRPRQRVDRGWLGVGLGPERVKTPEGSFKDGTRVAIRTVFPLSGAEAAGLKAGDVVLAIGGTAIVTVPQLVGLVGRHKVGDRLVVAYERGGKRAVATVILGKRPSPQDRIKQAWLGKTMPAGFTFREPLSGTDHALRDFRGKPLIIEYWATWCGPCKRAAPWLRALTKRYAAKGLQVIKISNQDPGAVRAHLQKVGHAADSKPLALTDPNDIIRQKLHLTAMPTFLYLDAKGTVRHISFGARAASELDKGVRAALNPPGDKAKPASSGGHPTPGAEKTTP